MADTHSTGISKAQFKLTFYGVHLGQNFLPIDRQQFRLRFGSVLTRSVFRLHIDNEFFGLDFVPLETRQALRFTHILPASYTLLTSRTDPLEPQPIGSFGAPS